MQTQTDIEVVPRREFVADVFDYHDGQHLTMLGPTQRGKTTLCFQLLNRVATPERKAVILHGKFKGRDPVIPKASESLNMRIVDSWPPTYRPGDKKRRGYILRPLNGPLSSTDEENEVLAREFKRAIHSNYKNTKAPTITVVDERAQCEEDLKIRKSLDGPLMRGAPHNGEWNNIQRGRFCSYHCYDAPEHLFVFYDPDLSNRKRYAEIGGVDPHYVEEVTENLQTRRVPSGGTISQTLYIRRSGPELYIVDF
jgi:hypothetical protein